SRSQTSSDSQPSMSRRTITCYYSTGSRSIAFATRSSVSRPRSSSSGSSSQRAGGVDDDAGGGGSGRAGRGGERGEGAAADREAGDAVRARLDDPERRPVGREPCVLRAGAAALLPSPLKSTWPGLESFGSM